jgi:hypothetical protein
MADIKKIVLTPKSTFTATVQKIGGRVAATDPITVRNQVNEIRSIDSIPGVNTSQRVDGAVIVYNANTNEYEVRSTYGNVVSISIQSLVANGSAGSAGQLLHTNGSTIYWGPVLNANNAAFAYGKSESDLSVNFALFSGTANYAYNANQATFASIANTANFAFGKQEGDLSVNFAEYSGTANFAYNANQATFSGTSNNSTFAYGKRESDLSVNFALFSGTANFAYNANNATYLNDQPASFYTNATNITTGILPSARLPNTAVVAGTYGNSTQITTITVDQYGRITNAFSSAALGSSGLESYNYISANNTFTIVATDSTVYYANISSVSDLTITGNLIVQGTVTTVNTQNLDVKDSFINLNKGQVSPLNDIGLLMQRYSSASSTDYNVGFAWKESSTKLIFGKTTETGSDSDVAFTQEWMTISQAGDVTVSGNLVFNIIDGGSY